MQTATRNVLKLTAGEAEISAELAIELSRKYASPEDPQLIFDLPFLAAGLPERTRRFLRSFVLEEAGGYCVLSGHRIDSERIGTTPRHWRDRERPGPEFPEEILLLLYGAVVGEPFGWATQQDGRLVHDVFPIKGHDHEQLGTGSSELLTWHIEDAFHPYRGDYLLLSALRNPDDVATTVGELDLSALPPEHVDTLFAKRFYIAPDESHLPKNNSTSGDAEAAERFASIERLISNRERVAVLYGSRRAPYLRLDPYFMEVPDDDPQARDALQAVTEVVDGALGNVVLDQGDVLCVNNHLAVHGRVPFRARYDGSDRWLKRINVTSDLRKSREMRASADSRLIG
ncbi:arginine beta-hydroxylase, Fe(II)/alpha-ketoglutarate-dependent [Streptomyces sp. NPDC052114]|uniref:arginine beta-hydroxylase, Fe(II)/alpha-ketoglutarate-dependent n=1 Tax=unclassified Streptomyces TaxID=2593676 RepID=UPI0034463AAC